MSYPPDFTAAEIEICERVAPHTMTSAERVVAAIRAIDYVVDNGIAGDVVECGVWRGGSTMAMAHALLRRGDTARTLFLFDTFSGMPPPGARDVQFDGVAAAALLAGAPREAHVWGVAALDDVRRNVESTGYPPERIRIVAGAVEETIPATLPPSIAVLRLDTDWYASTRHELVHLYPRLSDGGVLIVDDYGHWRGARDATDEYFGTRAFRPFLHRIDYTGVLAIKRGAA
jgi:predicted O-methyltransferase YrrM